MSKAPAKVATVGAGTLKTANKGLKGAPSLAKVEPCTWVTPIVTVVERTGFFSDDADDPASATLSIAVEGALAYVGTGTATIDNGGRLFSDPDCLHALGGLDAGVLLRGTTVYIGGTRTGECRIGLTLSAPANPAIALRPGADDTVSFTPINVITPVLGGDDLVLVHNGLKQPDGTTASELTVSFVESHPGEVAREFNLALEYVGAEIELRGKDGSLLHALTREQLGEPAKPRIRGKTAGNWDITATITGEKVRGWRYKSATRKVHVEKLWLDAFAFRDGLAEADELDDMVADVQPRRRELHQRRENIFPFAQLQMRQPSDAFWALASSIKLVSEAAVAIYRDPAATTPLPALTQADFAHGPVQMWVKTSANATALEAEPHGVLAWAAYVEKTPEKEITTAAITCTAVLSKAPAKELRNADLIRLDTYSLDRTLDRIVHNAARLQISPPASATLEQDCALACAEAHRYYNRRSALHVNRHENADGYSPFPDFMWHLGGNFTIAARANNGANFVETHLQGRGVTLAAAMKARIVSYISARLDYARTHGGLRDPYGFVAQNGLPGTHAECLAVNELMLQDVPPEQITVATYRLQNLAGQGKRFHACPNCRGILMEVVPAVRVITG